MYTFLYKLVCKQTLTMTKTSLHVLSIMKKKHLCAVDIVQNALRIASVHSHYVCILHTSLSFQKKENLFSAGGADVR